MLEPESPARSPGPRGSGLGSQRLRHRSPRQGRRHATAPDGLSWTNAFPGVTEALAVAQSGDEVWVAAGTYPGGITLADGIALYGGFAGDRGPSRDQRNFAANLDRLDGGRRDERPPVASGAGPNTRVDGFIIRNGLASASRARPARGRACASSTPTRSSPTTSS